MNYTTTTTNDIIVNGHEIVMKDSVVESVIEQFRSRSEVGKKKYGVTLDRDDLSTLEWIDHAIEESMDFILYLHKIKKQLNERA